MDLTKLSVEELNHLYEYSNKELRKRFADTQIDDSSEEESSEQSEENIRPGIQPKHDSSVFIDPKAVAPKKRGPKPGQDRQKPISKAQQYWDQFGPELYDDATREFGRLTAQQLMAKYACNTQEGKITKYMVSELVKIGKRQEGIST